MRYDDCFVFTRESFIVVVQSSSVHVDVAAAVLVNSDVQQLQHTTDTAVVLVTASVEQVPLAREPEVRKPNRCEMVPLDDDTADIVAPVAVEAAAVVAGVAAVHTISLRLLPTHCSCEVALLLQLLPADAMMPAIQHGCSQVV